MIAALELDRRLRAGRRRRGLSRRQRADRDPRGRSRVLALVARRGAERRLDRAAAAARRGGRAAAGSSGSTAARPTASWARTSRPCRAAVATAGSPWRRSLDVLSDRALWRMVALLATKPLLIAGLCVVALVPLALLAEILSLGVQGVAGLGDDRLPRAVAARARPRARAAGAGRRPPRCSWWPPSTRSHTRAAHHRPRAAGLARRAERARARDARREPGRPHRSRSPTGCPIARPSSTRRAGPSRCPSRDRGARGRRSSGTGAAWRRSSTTPRSTRAAELVQAAAAASSLAIDNERLKADLRARVEDLRVSRAAHRRGRRRGPPAHRARPPRRRPAAAAGARPRAARAARVDQRPGGRAAGRRARRAPGRRAARAARAGARHPPRDPHRAAGSGPRSPRSPSARRSRCEVEIGDRRSASRRRSRRRPTSSWPRR